MRSSVASVVVAALAFAPAVALAQQPPADTVTQVNRQHVTSVAQYEAARKKHMAWHKSQGDKWAWNVYDVATGPDTGAYVIASGGHSWADVDAWQAKLGAADSADAQATMGGTIEKTTTSYWMTVMSISRPPQSSAPAPFLAITYFQVKPGQDFAMMAAVTKIKNALEAAKFPPGAVWYRLTSGGPGSLYAVVVSLPNMAALGGPTVPATLVAHLGQQQAGALLAELFATVESTRTELLQHRPDLSYAP